MLRERVSGILLHVTSLPSYGGVGDFGPESYAFVDFLAASTQRIWQVLPLAPTGYGSSPYSALSAFAGNPLLISLERLADSGWISHERIAGLAGHDGPVDFERAVAEKLPLVEEAAAGFLEHATEADRQHFQKFCNENSSWLSDYALYTVLRRRFAFASWHEWPGEFARRESAAMSRVLTESAHELAVEQAVQFLFSEQWCSLRTYAHANKVQIMGDVAIFVNYDSADVWTNPDIFELDGDLLPIRVSGVPPDYFSATGQRWGNPLYRWSTLKQRGFDWWVARIRRALSLYDTIRLDHFRGFEAFWSIAADEETAVNGVWVKAPGNDLFHRLREVFGDLPFIAEDLGVITRPVDELRERFGMPGMRVLQFGFTDRGSHLYLPHRCVPNTVIYTGTHDNNTTLGWWLDDAQPAERANAQTYLGPVQHPAQIVWALMRAAARSVADICIFPMQDVLHLGSEARMNVPAAGHGNWTWRFGPGSLHPDLAEQLTELMAMTDRDGHELAVEGIDAGKPTEDASKRSELGVSI